MHAAPIPDWVVTSEETAASVRAWAEARGLRYQRLGLLPPASRSLRAHPAFDPADMRWSAPLHRVGLDGSSRTDRYGRNAKRPVRFSENVCWGELAPGLSGILAHHSSVVGQTTIASNAPFGVLSSTTAVVVMLPEGGRVTRRLEARPKPIGEATYDPRLPKELGPPQPVDLTPAFGTRYLWSLSTRDDPSLVSPILDADVMAALHAAPEHTGLTLWGGSLVVEAVGYRHDPATLDGLVRLAAAVARAVRAAAARLPRLEPGVSLPPPAERPYHRWARDNAARVEWSEPPSDLAAAARTYEAEGVGRRGCSVGTAVVAVMAATAIALRRAHA